MGDEEVDYSVGESNEVTRKGCLLREILFFLMQARCLQAKELIVKEKVKITER